jgi:hypothetical protein
MRGNLMKKNNFYSDLYYKLNGFNVNAIKKEHDKIAAIEKENICLYSKKAKLFIVISGLFVLLTFIASLVFSYYRNDLASIVKNIILLFLGLSSMILIIFKNRKTEIISTFLIVIIIGIVFLF